MALAEASSVRVVEEEMVGEDEEDDQLEFGGDPGLRRGAAAAEDEVGGSAANNEEARKPSPHPSPLSSPRRISTAACELLPLPRLPANNLAAGGSGPRTCARPSRRRRSRGVGFVFARRPPPALVASDRRGGGSQRRRGSRHGPRQAGPRVRQAAGRKPVEKSGDKGRPPAWGWRWGRGWRACQYEHARQAAASDVQSPGLGPRPPAVGATGLGPLPAATGAARLGPLPPAAGATGLGPLPAGLGRVPPCTSIVPARSRRLHGAAALWLGRG